MLVEAEDVYLVDQTSFITEGQETFSVLALASQQTDSSYKEGTVADAIKLVQHVQVQAVNSVLDVKLDFWKSRMLVWC